MSTCKSSIRYTGAILLALLWAGPAASPAPPGGPSESPGDPKAGRDLFISKGCMRCHSVWRDADKKGPNLASVGMGRNLYDVTASIWSHWTQMNAALQQDHLSRIPLGATEFRNIIAYLYYLNYYAEPGDAKLGAEIFAAKGCARCHGVEPLQADRRTGPAVYEMTQFRGPIALAVAVWNHGGAMSRRMQQAGIPWPEFREREVAHMMAFIRSRTPVPPRREMALPGDFRRGGSLYRGKGCASCHEPSGGGASLGPNLISSGNVASLTSLVGELWNHYPMMSERMTTSGASYQRIAQGEMEDLVAFIYWRRAYGLEGSASAGRRLHESKQCASCHAPGDKSSAPVLVGAGATRSVYTILASIWNHGPQMESLLKERNLPWPTLTGEEMRDLIAYFRSGS